MKQQCLRITILAGLLYSFMVSGAIAGYEGCEYKRQQLEHQLEYAQAYNNAHRVAGLQRALRRINEHCSDSRLLTQKENKLVEKKEKLQNASENWSRPGHQEYGKKSPASRLNWMKPGKNWLRPAANFPAALLSSDNCSILCRL